MKQRSITAVLFAIVMIGGIYWNQYSFQILFTLITAGMLWEFLGLVFQEQEEFAFRRKIVGLFIGLTPALWLGLTKITVAGWSIDCSPADLVFAGTVLYLTAFLTILAFTLELFWQSQSPAAALGKHLLGLFYIGLPIIFLYSLANPDSVYTPNRVFGLLWLIWTNDSCAYIVGSRLGKTKLFERISPKKTWEGAIGGAIGAMLMAWALAQFFPAYNLAQWLVLALLASVIGTLGDLVESMLKRNAGVKDSGNLLPGHGGLLDRFDSFIFVLPFAWLAVLLLEKG